MKISKLFHWLYFTVMMLPLFVVPIYFIYSQRHDLTEQTQVDIQYKYKSNEVHSIDDLIEGNIYHAEYLFLEQTGNGEIYFSTEILSFSSVSFNLYDYVDIDELNFGNYSANVDNCLFIYYGDDSGVTIGFTNYNCYVTYYYDIDLQFNDVVFVYFDDMHDLLNVGGIESYIQYTDFNVIESVQVEDTNTSITNAFVNSFADTIDKYFNYDNVVDFGSLYGWLNLTFFNNHAPLGFFIFWHLLEYWLLTSLLWLLFDVLLYVPNLIHRWLDKASLN